MTISIAFIDFILSGGRSKNAAQLPGEINSAWIINLVCSTALE
jgi:hypothetical protein